MRVSSAPVSIDHLVRQLAASQHSIVGARQLRAHGIDRSWVWRQVRAGRLHRVLPDAYFMGPGPEAMTRPSWQTAALHSCHLRGALYRETAIERLIGWKRGSAELHIVTETGRPDHDDPVIRFHRTRRLEPSDLVASGCDLSTSIERTILDLAYRYSAHQIANVLHDAAYHDVLDLVDLERRLEAERGNPWTAVVRRAIDLYRSGSAGTRSLSEDRFLETWLARGFPEPRVNDPSAVGVPGLECDFAWPDHRLIVEIDGERAHGRPNVQAKDLARDGALHAAGWRVFRISGDQLWRDLDACIALVRTAFVSMA